MRKDGYVSLWIGNVISEKILNEILKISYNEDGDFILSQFGRWFKTGRYNDDYREAKYYEQPLNSLDEVSKGFSYYENIMPKFKNLNGNTAKQSFNSVIFLYNFEYDGTEKCYNDGSISFEYIGTVQYK